MDRGAAAKLRRSVFLFVFVVDDNDSFAIRCGTVKTVPYGAMKDKNKGREGEGEKARRKKSLRGGVAEKRL